MKKIRLRMHLVFRWDLSPAMAIVAASHAGLGTYLTWESDPIMQEWQKTSFVKILHKALREDHWEFCKKLGEHKVFTESTLNGAETCLGFRVVERPTRLFDDIPLWSP